MYEKEKSIDKLKSAYESRIGPNLDNYSWFQSDVCLYRNERDRVMLDLLKKANIYKFSNLDIFEVGCGFGDNLLNLIRFGAIPERIWGSDIIESRVITARNRLPEGVNLITEDSSSELSKNDCFDLIIQFTVFSSILSDQMQTELASNLLKMLKKDGCILWYDFLYSNPRNANVRGCSKKRIKELFPDTEIIFKKVTLAPPLSRVLVRRFPFLYSVLNIFPIFRTHIFALIKKLD